MMSHTVPRDQPRLPPHLHHIGAALSSYNNYSAGDTTLLPSPSLAAYSLFQCCPDLSAPDGSLHDCAAYVHAASASSTRSACSPLPPRCSSGAASCDTTRMTSSGSWTPPWCTRSARTARATTRGSSSSRRRFV
ncbi:hypothetical protein Cni_G02323 [Canna indica]|uniref:Uncharacterized protein n=1 Tax=Canna indica TaxID=4628 RepID=A0AAQ3PZZ4_9LILI|nr:hypothetical protein Cni_G02323 [Canna indica]